MNWRLGLTISIDPDAVKDYLFDWTDWLGTDTIASYVLTPAAGMTLPTESNTATGVTAWVTFTTTADLKCHIVTAAGREDDRTVTFEVVEH